MQVSAVGALATPAPRRQWEVRSDPRVGLRFHFRRGITSVVPWLVVSESGRASHSW